MAARNGRMNSAPAPIESTGWCRTTFGMPGIVPANSSSTDGLVAPETAIVQPSQLIPASQNTWSSSSGPSALPPRPPKPDVASEPKTAPACGTFCSFSCSPLAPWGSYAIPEASISSRLRRDCVQHTYTGMLRLPCSAFFVRPGMTERRLMPVHPDVVKEVLVDRILEGVLAREPVNVPPPVGQALEASLKPPIAEGGALDLRMRGIGYL